MASSADEGDMDEMASMFEGMILFDPSSEIKTPPPPPAVDDDLPHSITSSAVADADAAPPIEVAASQPLDENLFSDLTIVTTDPFETPHSDLSFPHPPSQAAGVQVTSSTPEVATPLVSTVHRQLSSRKKKRAGLRIGYGRDSQIHDLSDSSQSFKPQQLQRTSSSSSSSSPSQAPLLDSGKDEQIETPSSSITLDSNGTEVAVGDVSLTNTTSGSGDTLPATTCDTITVNAAVQNVPVDISEEDDLIIEKQADNITTATANISSSPIELRFDHIKAQISEKLNHSREIVVSLSASRKDLIRRRRKVAEDLSVAWAKHKELEKELEEACEAEDFETADRISNSLASAEKNKELLSVALRQAEADCDAVDFEMQEALTSQITAEMECAHLLQSFSMDAARDADSVLESAEKMTSKEMDKWVSSSEALEIKKIGLEMESYLVSEVQLELNDSIEHSIKDERGEQEILLKKKEMLKEELEKLLALVKQKEVEIAENESNIEKVQKKITDAVSSCQKLQSYINSTFNNLQLGLSQIELESEDLSRRKKEIDGFLSQEEARISKIRELARISVDEATMYQEAIDLRKSLVRFISKSQEDKVRLAKNGEKLSVDLQMLKQDISVERASLQDLFSGKSRVQQVIESYKQRLVFIDKRVPELEAEKKVAATARNFKEAGRIATEAKSLYAEKEQVQIKMEEAMLELKKLDVDISCIMNRVEELEEQMSLKEKELGRTRYERLLLVAAAAMAERSTALELGDHEEADILLREAQAAETEAKKLQPVCNLKGEESENGSKQLFISMELISSLGRNQLAQLAASANISCQEKSHS